MLFRGGGRRTASVAASQISTPTTRAKKSLTPRPGICLRRARARVRRARSRAGRAPPRRRDPSRSVRAPRAPREVASEKPRRRPPRTFESPGKKRHRRKRFRACATVCFRSKTPGSSSHETRRNRKPSLLRGRGGFGENEVPAFVSSREPHRRARQALPGALELSRSRIETTPS
jgi:hypothetical protein